MAAKKIDALTADNKRSAFEPLSEIPSSNAIERSAPSLERRPPTRRKHASSLLIACDAQIAGYLECLLHGWHLHHDVTLLSCHPDNAQSIIEQALRAARNKSHRRCFAVIACDDRAQWLRLCRQFSQIHSSLQIVASVPTLQLWWYLHLQELPSSALTDAQQLTQWLDQPLAKELPFAELQNKIELAVNQAQWLVRLHNVHPAIQPWTNLQELITFLIKLRSKNERLRG
ncbi:MAG: hypothetical protein HQM06_05295 [Magnetococcales bacterium]|nr:hypothetical protein [Magnetococcales bacterium]